MTASSLDDLDLVVRTMAKTIVDNEDYFAELDSIVGDGDFGYSLGMDGRWSRPTTTAGTGPTRARSSRRSASRCPARSAA